MREYLGLGPTPGDEDCIQVGTDDYLAKARTESKVWLDQLERKYPTLDFRIKYFPHDFGAYLEVVVYYDEADVRETKAAFKVENNLPRHWDRIATKKLKENQCSTDS